MCPISSNVVTLTPSEGDTTIFSRQSEQSPRTFQNITGNKTKYHYPGTTKIVKK